MAASHITPVLVVRAGAGDTPYWEAKWRSGGRQYKRRVPGGSAWAERSSDGSWVAKGGRARNGALTRDRAAVAALELVAVVEAQLDGDRAEAARLAREPLTFRAVAAEWLNWLARVKGAKPSTLSDYDYLLREPGTPYKRGDRVSKGRILGGFGDRDVRDVTPREVEKFLAALDAEGLAPRNVNKHRALLCAVFAYAQRVDSYGLPTNPAAMTDKRREALPAVLEFYEPHEVELLAETIASGTWRKDRPDLSADERVMRTEEDARDGDLFRVLFFTGLRLGELRALRWGAVDLEGRVLLVKAALSVGVEVDPKGRAYRWTPLTTGAVDALQRHLDRSGTRFTTLDDYVFCGRFGEPIDAGALRRRYKAARQKAGLRDVKLHGLRHAAGSIYARQASAVEVRDFLGHAKLSTTDRYVSARMTPEALARLDAAFAPNTSPRERSNHAR